MKTTIVGLLFGENASMVEPLGDLFLRLIQFIIVPLILATIIVGVTSAGNIKKLAENDDILFTDKLSRHFHRFTCRILVFPWYRFGYCTGSRSGRAS